VGEADVASGHRFNALGHAINVFADRKPIGGGAAAHVAVEPDPVDG
jgi:hypothetical protein